MKKFSFILLLVSALSSCGKTEKAGPDNDPVPIRISTTVTRATDNAFESGDRVGLFVVNQPKSLTLGGNYVDNLRFTFDGANWNAEKQIFWIDDTTKGDFYCYYPYTSSVRSVDAFPFEVSQDQSGENGYKASDFFYGRVLGVSPTPDPISITMNHSMSSLIVKLKAGTGWKDDDLKVAEVKLCGLKTSAVINLENGEVKARGTESDIKTNAIGGGSFRALVVPQEVKDAELVKIKVGDNSYSLKTTINLQSGRQHTCTVTLNRAGEGIRIDVGPWDIDDVDYGGSVE